MLSLKDNIATIADVVGAKNVGLVWGLSNVNWQSEQERDDFLRTIVAGKNGA
jgi:hypothetical protein